MIIRTLPLLTLCLLWGGVAAPDAVAADPPSFKRGTKAFPKDTKGRRVAFGDVDGDGDPDVLLSGRLFVNDGSCRFTLAPRSAGLGRSAAAAAFADYDRDGDLDVFLSGHGVKSDRLMRNDTSSKPGAPIRFVDVTVEVGGLSDGLPGEGIGWGDLNGDGYPDLYVANYELGGLARGTVDRLYLSDGRGGFTHNWSQVFSSLCGRGVSMADFDQDGDTDVFVSNYRLQQNLMWVNTTRETGRFGLVEDARGRGLRTGYTGHTIGSAWGDLDNDGKLDLVSANLAHPWLRPSSERTVVFLQGDYKRFTHTTAGIKYEETHSDPTLFDADNDGDLDLYLTSVYGGRPGFLYRNRLLEDGKFTFRDATEVAKAKTYDGWGAASADVDGDGDLDLLVSAQGRPVLLTNTRDSRHRSVRLRLKGSRSDTWGAGATATLEGKDVPRQVRQLNLVHGTSSQSEPLLHFGVGKAKGPFSVTVNWPSGAVSKVKLHPGLHTVEEPLR